MIFDENGPGERSNASMRNQLCEMQLRIHMRLMATNVSSYPSARYVNVIIYFYIFSIYFTISPNIRAYVPNTVGSSTSVFDTI